VALMGAHSLGHTHIANSGYGFVNPGQSPTRLNAWDLTPAVLDNGYYIDLVRNVSFNRAIILQFFICTMWGCSLVQNTTVTL